VLRERGLVRALGALAEHAPIPVDVEGDIGRLPEPIETAVFFVCSEALANAAKHAAASCASIELHEDRGRLVVTIADDGVGGASPSQGSGLRGLADRIEALGGRLNVHSPPGAGTKVSAEVPVAPTSGSG
jgi:signal transduction histidine kinase